LHFNHLYSNRIISYQSPRLWLTYDGHYTKAIYSRFFVDIADVWVTGRLTYDARVSVLFLYL